MELLQNLGTRKSRSGKSYQSMGVFLCPHCNLVVERLLNAGRKQISCGCRPTIRQTVHGYSRRGIRHPLYYVWKGMVRRCSVTTCTSYQYYGGRGIKVCDEWRQDIGAFIAWSVHNGWRAGYEIDRIDNNGDYTPHNCRYVTPTVNKRNRSNVKLNPDTVREIRWLNSVGIARKELASITGVTHCTISDVIRNITWQNIV
jgi:hypothetical protein